MMFPTSYACAKRIAEVLNTKSTIVDGSFPLEQRPLRSTVEFRNVTFAYPGADEPVLKDINFISKPGEITAIIGGTGRVQHCKVDPKIIRPIVWGNLD
jgi:ABC-type multidrug transport system fused ATPase/permease subunit